MNMPIKYLCSHYCMPRLWCGVWIWRISWFCGYGDSVGV